MNVKKIRKKLRQQHHQIFQELQKNRCLQYVETLLQDEVLLQESVSKESNISSHLYQVSPLTEVISQQLSNTKKQLSIQKQKLNRVNSQQVYSDTAQNSINKILELNQKINKLKQFYLYCKYLKKSTTQLENDIEKYFEYQKKESTVCEEVQAYLGNSYVSDIIFKEYLKTYNVNIFTSDLITHYFELNKKGLLIKGKKQAQDLVFQPQRIPQLCLLEKNIVFKQLYDINEKYTMLCDNMKGSYVQNLIELLKKLDQTEKIDNTKSVHNANESQLQQYPTQQSKKTHNPFEDYNLLITEKLQNLNYLINKMSLMGTNLNQNVENQHIPLIVNQYHENFLMFKKLLSIKNCYLINTKEKNEHYKKFIVSIMKNNQSSQSEKQSLAAFFQQNLIVDDDKEQEQKDSENNEQKISSHNKKFEFLQNKIIKTQTLVVLNKVFSAFNVFSYIYQQINSASNKETQYTFQSLIKHIQCDFKGEFIKKQLGSSSTNVSIKKTIKTLYHSPSHKSHYNLFIQNDEFGNWILLTSNQKLLYPSAIFGFVEMLHYMCQVATLLEIKGLYSDEIMLQILSLKAQQISKICQVILNIYNIIKSKQVSSYDILSQYLIVNMKAMFQWQLEWINKLDLSHEEQDMFKNQLQLIQASKHKSLRQDLEIDHEKQYQDQKKRIQEEIKKIQVSKFLTFYANKAKKADFLSQIVYEMDSSYEIEPILEELLRCEQFHNRTFYFYDNTQFYETVLYEIIQMRNHIKLDHYYTLPRLHQKFGFFTIKALSFGDILSQLSKLSINQIKVQQLLMFFKIQLRLKRNVFRGELHWLNYKKFAQNGKQKSFKDFVQEQGSELFSLAQEPLEYFLTNMKDFIRKVTMFEEEIEKFKYYEDILGKMNKSQVKIKNLDSSLNILTNPQLEQLTKILHYYNPVSIILKNQQPSKQLFTDIKTTLQLNKKIRLQDIARNVCLLEQKQKLSEDLFYHNSFGFELNYHDCFNIFVQSNKKSNHFGDDSLKLIINRQRSSIVRNFDDILVEQKKNIYLTLIFYRHSLIISLLLAKEELIDEDDKEIIEELIENLSFPDNLIQLINYLANIFSTDKQNGKQDSQEIYLLLKVKKFLLKLSKLKKEKQDIESITIYNNNRAIENICLIAKLTIYTQKKIVQKIQLVHQEITLRDVTININKKQRQLDLLNNKLLSYFLSLLKKYLNEHIARSSNDQSIELNFTTIQQAMYQIEYLLLQKLLTLNQLQSPIFKNKQELVLFDRLNGYKIKQGFDQTLVSNSRQKDMPRRNDRKILKKGVFSPVRSPNASQSNVMQSIQKRVGIEMIKQSMGLRKVISKLELQQKKMKDQISWQTSLLEHNVINKIHSFIAESNIDQEQSYINFKYTVNLETIKGMQNVIKQQTELAYKATMTNESIHKEARNDKQQKGQQLKFENQAVKEDANGFFLTNPTQHGYPQRPQSLLGSQNSHMLNTNIDSIFNHLKKIKVFAAWKKINRNMDMANQQWSKFNKNVASILHNQQNIKRVQVINEKRGQCFKQNILCSLLKEQNKILSEKIRTTKMETLNKTIQKYRNKLTGQQVNCQQ